MNSEFGNSPTNAILNIRKHHASEKPEFNLDSKTITRVRERERERGRERERIENESNIEKTRKSRVKFFYRNLNGTCCFDQDPAKFFSQRRRNRLYHPFSSPFHSNGIVIGRMLCFPGKPPTFPENNCTVDSDAVRGGKCE